MPLIYVSILFALEIVCCLLVYIPFDHKIRQLTYQEKVQNMSEFYYSNCFWKFLRFTKSGDLIRSIVLLCLVMDKSKIVYNYRCCCPHKVWYEKKLGSHHQAVLHQLKDLVIHSLSLWTRKDLWTRTVQCPSNDAS